MTEWFAGGNPVALACFVALQSILVFYALLNFLFALKFRPSPALQVGPNPEPVVILVPVKDDPSIFNSLPSLLALDYPNSRILIVDDSRDPSFVSRLSENRSERVEVFHRAVPRGRKAGALNASLERLAAEAPTFVVVLDADHRPPRDFLARAVALIEQTNADCVLGHQRHDIGDDGLFGRFYRAGNTTTFRALKAQHDLGFAVFYTGAAAIFRYDWLRRMGGFDEASITEDWELALRAQVHGSPRFVIREDLWVSAAVPTGLGALLRQEIRWMSGLIRDFRKHARPLVRSNLRTRAKVGLSAQGLLGVQAPAFLAFWLAFTFVFPLQLPLLLTFALVVLLGFLWGWPTVRASRAEGYGPRQIAGILAYGLFVWYVLAPVAAFAFLWGLLGTPSYWSVTKRRG